MGASWNYFSFIQSLFPAKAIMIELYFMVTIAILIDSAITIQTIAMKMHVLCVFVVLEDIEQLRCWKRLRTIETIKLLELTLITESHVHRIGAIVFRWHCSASVRIFRVLFLFRKSPTVQLHQTTVYTSTSKIHRSWFAEQPCTDVPING